MHYFGGNIIIFSQACPYVRFEYYKYKTVLLFLYINHE